MTVLMIGGLLDGELREVPDGKWRVDAYEHHGLDQPHTITRYHIANGIARHESVSEEEVAVRVSRWKACYDAGSDPDYGATDAQREALARIRAECSDDR